MAIENVQKAWRLDPVTLQKTLKGAIIAAGGGAALYLLQFLGTIEINQPEVAALVAWLVPTLINGVRELMKGK